MSPMADTIEAVRRDVTVDAPVERAFDVFVARMGSWWPAEHHTGEQPIVDVLVPSTVGATWGEVDAAGTHGPWGHVLAYDAPRRVLLSWGLQPEDWEYDPDTAKHSEIEVTFTPAGDGRTRVVLTHAKFENHGAGGRSMADSVGTPDGWAGIMQSYAASAAGAGPA